MVKQLRDSTGAGMMDCKKALQECEGSIEEATAWLRKKGMASADKKASRIAAEGAVVSYIHAGNRIGVMLELNCETDFVARGDRFKELAQDLAMQVAACPEVEYINPSDADQEMVERERAIEMQKEDLLSKPENIREKIVAGRIDKLVNEKALVTKDYIKDTSKTVEELVKEATAEIGEKISIRRFTRYNLGEGIEKRNEDFAAEVAAQTQVKAAEPEPKKEEPKEEKKEEEAPAVKVDAKLVKQLRDSTGAGMMDCKKALAQNNNDIEEATAWLRKKGMASADKKASRIAAEGAVVSYIHAGSRIGVLLELNCETDFVARGDRFKELAQDLAMQVAACPEVEYINPSDADQEMVERERAIEMQKEDLLSKPENIREKIVAGRIDKLVNEKALVTKDYIKDTSKTVEELVKEATAEIGEKISIRRFTRYNLGEGIEKRNEDFAAEVAAQMGK
jgi:elongation factor Ts